MKKLVFVLLLGVGAGYQIGWQDAQKNTESIVKRTIDKVGGNSRGKYGNDIDGQMDRLEKR